MSALTLDELETHGGDIDTFFVCPVDGMLVGRVGDRWQTCRCHPELESEWTGDLARLAELCRTCGAALIRSGSRWSLFHCERCMDVWRKRREDGLVTPPFGRHSFMNQVPVDPDDPGVADGVCRMVATIDTLDGWYLAIVQRTIDTETPLLDYLALVEPSSPEEWLRR